MTISEDLLDTSEAADRQAESARQQNRGLRIAVVVLALCALGLGAVVIRDVVSGDDAAVPEEITQLLEEFETAYDTNDGDLFRSIISEDYFLTDEFYQPGDRTPNYTVAGPDYVGVRGVETYGWQVERLGEPIVTGDGPWFVAVGEKWTEPPFTDTVGTATYTNVTENGAMKIAKYYWAGVYDPVEHEFDE